MSFRWDVMSMAKELRNASSRRFYVVFNPLSGSAAALGLTVDALERKFLDAGLTAEIDANSELPLDTRIAKALTSATDVIVAAGGDGTVTALAGAIVESQRILALLPLGTANLLARDLRIPLDLDEAIAGLATMKPRRIDVGEMNGRIFLHKAVIGTFPAIAAAREEIRGDASLRARFAFIRYFLGRISNARRIALHIDPIGGGEKRIERVQAVAVANNAYDEGVGQFFSRARLDRGKLTVYTLKRLTLPGIARLTLEMLAGRWRQDSALVLEHVEGVVLQMKKQRMQVMIDGEVDTLPTPFAFRIRPQALSILAPEEDEADDQASGAT